MQIELIRRNAPLTKNESRDRGPPKSEISFLGGYQAFVPHLLCHNRGVEEVKSNKNFVMDPLETCISIILRRLEPL
jgi:hypothetical protein